MLEQMLQPTHFINVQFSPFTSAAWPMIIGPDPITKTLEILIMFLAYDPTPKNLKILPMFSFTKLQLVPSSVITTITIVAQETLLRWLLIQTHGRLSAFW